MIDLVRVYTRSGGRKEESDKLSWADGLRTELEAFCDGLGARSSKLVPTCQEPQPPPVSGEIHSYITVERHENKGNG